MQEGLGDRVAALATLTGLTSLDLRGNQIGAEGARALGHLTGLTSLDLRGNQIGAEGARALGHLTGLTSLDLRGNQIGAEGARALGQLTGLTSLDLRGNRIGAEGARALGQLTGLTSLKLRDNQIGAEGARALTQLTGLTSLDLSFNQIEAEAARALGHLTGLTSLDLRGNQIGDEGARALGQLTGLTLLDLHANQIGDDGARALGQLVRLNSLGLSGNQIGNEGARALGQLIRLNSLDLRGNRIGDEGARALGQLTGLTLLDLSNNQIGDEGARALGQLVRLTWLDLRGNQIGDEGARALGQLTGLTSLDLRENQIGDEGARALGQLTRLTSLDLSENQVGDEGTASLLDALSTSRSLTRLRLDEASPILPGEVLGTGDAQAILAAYRRYRDARKQAALRPLNEGKVLVVGNEAVGKTSLIRALVQRTPCDPNEQKTAGTAIHEKIEVSAWSPERSELTLNVWDFGGQEIMRGTHRFFLTERSLYLLVLEDRRQDDRSIFTWLETIEQRGGDSPVLVVINKSDGLPHQLQLDEPALQRDHPAIVGFVRTSCRDSPTAIASIAALRARIVATINRSERLTHVRDSIPLTWLRVKDAIAALARERSVLPVREFERLCEEGAADERVMDKAEQRGLLGLLHDLGVVVAHGLRRDATAALREVTVLDPNWLTGAIYALINSPAVRNDGGELHYEQLPELLDLTRYPPERYELILTMMQDPAFGLCIPIAGGRTHRYLLPDAVPTREPDCGHWPDDALRFRFQYSIVPVDLMPRFIAEAHLILTDRPTWWKAGVVLGAEGCRILVRVEPTRQRVEILVDGTTGKLAALGIVRNYLNAVHSRYAKLDVKAKVPLPDQPEVDVSYDHLVKLEERYGLEHSFDPEGAQRAYRVRELIEGVRHDRSWDRSEGSMSRDPGDRDERDDRRDRASHTDRTISIHASGGSTVTVAAPMTVAEGAVGVASEASASTPEPQGRPWWQVAAGSAVAAVVLAVVIYLLPTNHWRMLVGGLTTLALIVFVVVLRRDPAGFYRRALSYVIVAGVGINALGFTFDAFVKHPSAEGRMTFQSATSDWFFPAWAVIVIALVFGDLRTRLPRR